MNSFSKRIAYELKVPMPIISLETLNSDALPYHVGIAVLIDMSGLDLDLNDYRKVDSYIYMGSEDDNDTLPMMMLTMKMLVTR